MQLLWNKLDRPALATGSADQFILADEQDQILDQLSELRLIILISAVIKYDRLHIVVADKHSYYIPVCDVQGMPEYV